MMNAPHGKEFVFHDGTRARNLSDLVSVLEKISDHDFHHFVNTHKNDFANWINHVLSDTHLSEKLRTVHSKEDTLRLIKEKISETTIGNSVIKIPRIEDHSVHESKAQHHSTGEKEDSRERDSNVVQQQVDDTKSITPKHSKNWFRIFSKKNSSEAQHIKSKEHDTEKNTDNNTKEDSGLGSIKLSKNKIVVDELLQDDPLQNERENTLWIVLYFALVLLIITLLIYKLFL